MAKYTKSFLIGIGNKADKADKLYAFALKRPDGTICARVANNIDVEPDVLFKYPIAGKPVSYAQLIRDLIVEIATIQKEDSKSILFGYRINGWEFKFIRDFVKENGNYNKIDGIIKSWRVIDLNDLVELIVPKEKIFEGSYKLANVAFTLDPESFNQDSNDTCVNRVGMLESIEEQLIELKDVDDPVAYFENLKREFLHTSNPPVDLVMPYGKYRGRKVVDVFACDRQYLAWMVGQLDVSANTLSVKDLKFQADLMMLLSILLSKEHALE